MTHRQRKTRRRRRRGAGGKVLVAFAVVAVVGVIGVLSVAGYVLAIAATAPELSQLKPAEKGQTSVVFAADGSRLGYVQSDIIRKVVPFADMPPVMRQATVAIEDERFYKHGGVDFNAIIRAGVKNLESGDTVQGGSTITQQLVRALYIKDPKRDYERKIREAKLAQELEDEHSKRWILHQYLNTIPYGTVGGRTALGVEAAAVTFFNRHAKDLDLPEAATLAGLPQAPSQYNPFRNPAVALERRNEVLDKMRDNGYITQAEADEAMQEPLDLHRGTRFTTRREPYVFDYVQEELIQKYGVGVVRRGGLRIYTTIDPALQDAARNAIAGQLYDPGDPSSAIVTIDPGNGYIRAMASSGTYKDRTFNLAAQGHRQPGSSFKTMVLTAAVRKGIDPDSTTYVSKPLEIDDPTYGHWSVKTYAGTYSGSESLTRATLASDNTVYAQLILDIGPKAVCETAKLMGITSKLNCYPAEGLGGLQYGVSPLEMADAYATLASGGIHSEPKAIRKVVFPDGKSDDVGKPQRKRVFSDGVAAEVTKILEQNVQAGTGTAANIGCPTAGKTGTTDNFNDAWFVGYTPHLSSAVWVGYPNALVSMAATRIGAVAGGTWPAMIWHDYMNVAKGDDCDSFPAPTEPVQFQPFFGKYSRTGAAGTGGYYDGSSTSAGGDDYTGYDPRLYESPPQQAPNTEQPQQEAPPAQPQTPAPQDGTGGAGTDQTGGAAPQDGNGQ
jgi:penicillin-binding protein 1A